MKKIPATNLDEAVRRFRFMRQHKPFEYTSLRYMTQCEGYFKVTITKPRNPESVVYEILD